jgi:hypothetical protein
MHPDEAGCGIEVAWEGPALKAIGQAGSVVFGGRPTPSGN